MENGRRPDLYSERGDRQQDQKVLTPYNYVLQARGGNLLFNFMAAINRWLKVPADKMRQIDDIMQTLQNALILIDDVQDNSVLRRGLPVAHSVYGIDSTINAANYAMIIGLEKCLALNHPDAVRIFTEQLLEFHRGQGMEIYWRNNHICPSEEEYSEMTKQKTGGFGMLATRLMQLFSECKEDFSELVGVLGIHMQIRNDYDNLYSKGYIATKSFCDDLTEGKFSFPLIHAINSENGENRVMRILRQRTRDNELKKYCVSLLESYGSFAHTMEKLVQMDQKIKTQIAHLEFNPLLEELLHIVLNAPAMPES